MANLQKRWAARRKYERDIRSYVKQLRGFARAIQGHAHSIVSSRGAGPPYRTFTAPLKSPNKPKCNPPTKRASEADWCWITVMEVVKQMYPENISKHGYAYIYELAKMVLDANPRMPRGSIDWASKIRPGTKVKIPSFVTIQSRELTSPGLIDLGVALDRIAGQMTSQQWNYRHLSKSLGELKAFTRTLKERTAKSPALKSWGSQMAAKIDRAQNAIARTGLTASAGRLIEGPEGTRSSSCGEKCIQTQNAAATAFMVVLTHSRPIGLAVARALGSRNNFGSTDFEKEWWSSHPVREESPIYTDSLDVTSLDPEHQADPLRVADWTHRDLAGSGSYRNKPLQGLVIHSTAGNDGSTSIPTLEANNLSYHYIVERDGSILKLVDPHYRSIHAGGGGNRFRNEEDRSKSPNDVTISIALANRSWVARDDGNTDMAARWRRYSTENQELGHDRWKEGSGYFHNPAHRPSTCNPDAPGCNMDAIWEVFPDDQVRAAARLSAYILQRHDLDSGSIYMHSDLSHPRGRKQDPGPLFPQSDFFHYVDGTQTNMQNSLWARGYGAGRFGASKVKQCVSSEFLSDVSGMPLCSTVSFEDREEIQKSWVPLNIAVTTFGIALLGAIYVDLSRDRKYLRDTESTLL